jgi:hypothetical protein
MRVFKRLTSRMRAALATCAVVMLAFAAFSPVMHASLTADDYVLASEVRSIRSFWDVWEEPTAVEFYRPIPTLMIWALDSSPVGLRVVGLLLHVLCAFLTGYAASLVVERHTGRAHARTRSIRWFATLAFLFLPRQACTVGWAMNAAMVTLPIIGSSIAILEYESRRRSWWILALGLCTAVGLLIKENAAVIPGIAAILIATDPRRPSSWRKVLWANVQRVVRHPAFVIPTVVVASYLAFRFHLMGGLGGYHLEYVTGETTTERGIRVATNVLRYPVVSLVPPPAIFQGTRWAAAAAMMMICATAAFLSSALSGRLQNDSSPAQIRARAPLLVCGMLYVVTVAPTLLLSPSFLTMAGGHSVYVSAVWLAVMVAIVAHIARFRGSAAVLGACFGLLVCAAWLESSTIARAGELADQEVAEYQAYARLHPQEDVAVASTIGTLAGAPVLFCDGLRRALIVLGAPQVPSFPPLIGVSLWSESDSIATVRLSDSTLSVTDFTPGSYVGTCPIREVFDCILHGKASGRASMSITSDEWSKRHQNRTLLVVRGTHLVPLER